MYVFDLESFNLDTADPNDPKAMSSLLEALKNRRDKRTRFFEMLHFEGQRMAIEQRYNERLAEIEERYSVDPSSDGIKNVVTSASEEVEQVVASTSDEIKRAVASANDEIKRITASASDKIKRVVPLVCDEGNRTAVLADKDLLIMQLQAQAKMKKWLAPKNEENES